MPTKTERNSCRSANMCVSDATAVQIGRHLEQFGIKLYISHIQGWSYDEASNM